jgi:hypothetical protein
MPGLTEDKEQTVLWPNRKNDRGGRALEQGREREVRWRLPDISAFYIGVRRG